MSWREPQKETGTSHPSRHAGALHPRPREALGGHPLDVVVRSRPEPNAERLSLVA
jgi:hypothetical protein